MFKTMASMFFLASGYFTVNVLYKNMIGIDLQLVSTAVVATIFGVAGHFMFEYIKRHRVEGFSKGNHPAS